MALEKIALEDDYFVSRKLYPNVDFYSGIVQRAIGIPVSLFTAIFALARTVGWIAQLNEMIGDPEYKIGRPRQLYAGSPSRNVLARVAALNGLSSAPRRPSWCWRARQCCWVAATRWSRRIPSSPMRPVNAVRSGDDVAAHAARLRRGGLCHAVPGACRARRSTAPISRASPTSSAAPTTWRSSSASRRGTSPRITATTPRAWSMHLPEAGRPDRVAQHRRTHLPIRRCRVEGRLRARPERQHRPGRHVLEVRSRRQQQRLAEPAPARRPCAALPQPRRAGGQAVAAAQAKPG